MTPLAAQINRFNGVIVDPTELPHDPGAFQDQLAHSLVTWRAEGRLTVWLEIPHPLAALIPIATAAGFTFHHSTDSNHPGPGYLMLTCRLKPAATIPSFATHHIGAGGVVLNEARELLVVSERHRRDTSRPYYKLPGGVVEHREHLADAVVREVFEETGIQAEFEALVCLRHWHGYRHDKSDIYFICRLRPLSHTIHLADREIETCLWMPVDDYLQSEYVSEFNRRVVQAALTSPGIPRVDIEDYTGPDREIFLPA